MKKLFTKTLPAKSHRVIFIVCLIYFALIMAVLFTVRAAMAEEQPPLPTVGYDALNTGGFFLATEDEDRLSHLESAPLHLGVSMADVDLPAKEGYLQPFQVMMVDEHIRSYGGIRGVSTKPIKLVAPFTKGDLSLVLTEEGDRLQCSFVFDLALLSDADVATWLAKFVALIDQFTSGQDGLASLSVGTAIQKLRIFSDG